MRNMREVWAALSPAEKQAVPRKGRGRIYRAGVPSGPAEMAGLQLMSDNAINPKALAPCCGRARSLDYLVDLRPMATALREQSLAAAGLPNVEIVCSSCIERLRRMGVMKWSDLASHLGAPQAVVDNFLGAEARRKARIERVGTPN